MAATAAHLNAVRDAMQALMTYIGLVDDTGTELAGGSYARKAVTWTDDGDGVSRPNADLDFDVPAGTVGGWRAYSASSGGTDYGGEDLTQETFAAAGVYRLLAAETSWTYAAS